MNLKHQEKIVLEFSRELVKAQNFTISGIKIWNSLDINLKKLKRDKSVI